jgi:hypothetical protein
MSRTMNASIQRPTIAALLLLAASACGAVQNAAARDPMKCEQDPACAKGKGTYTDCSKQCSDNPECMDHCKSMQIDRAGHP